MLQLLENSVISWSPLSPHETLS